VAETPTLTDGVVILDGFTADDVAAHLAGEDEEHARRFGWYPRRSTEESVRAAISEWQEAWRSDGETRAFATRDADSRDLLGGCQLRLREKRIGELSYWTHPTHRRRGVASRAVRLLCAFAFAFAELDVERLEAYIEPDNLASRRVVESLGFSEEGVARARELTVSGERRDMVVYSLLPAELEAQPHAANVSSGE
jgi:[ribosomal protein S5]-alanine N-acetyltransferase